jgi:hypothetical protein
MFDLTKQPILVHAQPSRPMRERLAMLALAAITSTTFGACFNGNAADGLPCNDDAQCGSGTECIEGYCGGVFLCADGSQIDAIAVCNAEADCEDASDEDSDTCGGGGANINQCDETDGDLSYQLGNSAPAPGNAIKVEAIDIMGSPAPDAIVASRDGDHVKIAFDLDTTAPKEYFFKSPPPSFDDRTVFAYEVGEVNGDMKDDVVIVTFGEQAVVYVYQNMAPDPPELFGTEIVVPDYMVGMVTIRGVELGRLNNDSSTDIVAILDITGGDLLPAANGVLLVSFGDSGAAASGQPYFNPQVVPENPLQYDMFVDSDLADIDGDGFDDLLVVGAGQNGPGLWMARRAPSGDFTSWSEPIKIPIAAAGYLAVGHFQDSPPPGEPLPGMPDIGILDLNSGLIQTMVNTGGMLQPGGSTTLSGSGFASLSIADINCDGQGDFIYNLADPAEIRVLFGDGLGGVLSNVPLTYVDEGTPRGGLGIARFDGDATPDIFTADDPGPGQMDSQVRVLTSKPQ